MLAVTMPEAGCLSVRPELQPSLSSSSVAVSLQQRRCRGMEQQCHTPWWDLVLLLVLPRSGVSCVCRSCPGVWVLQELFLTQLGKEPKVEELSTEWGLEAMSSKAVLWSGLAGDTAQPRAVLGHVGCASQRDSGSRRH